MDEFEDRLKRDAEEIKPGDTTALRARVDASLRATQRIRPVPAARDSGINIWWASSITGLAAAIAVIAVINWNAPPVPVEAPEPLAGDTVPDYVDEFQGLYPPRLKTADFTDPLEAELAKLQADIDKARQNVKEDIEFSF
jgi:hypothetical protein